MRNFSNIVEKIKIHILRSLTFFPENRAVYEIMSKTEVEAERPQITIWLRVARWISKTSRTQTHTRACAHTRTRTHAGTHTEIYNIYCFSTAIMVL
jgi:hypothetical protein